eukprot:Awhi_evm1s13378
MTASTTTAKNITQGASKVNNRKNSNKSKPSNSSPSIQNKSNRSPSNSRSNSPKRSSSPKRQSSAASTPNNRSSKAVAKDNFYAAGPMTEAPEAHLLPLPPMDWFG